MEMLGRVHRWLRLCVRDLCCWRRSSSCRGCIICRNAFWLLCTWDSSLRLRYPVLMLGISWQHLSHCGQFVSWGSTWCYILLEVSAHIPCYIRTISDLANHCVECERTRIFRWCCSLSYVQSYGMLKWGSQLVWSCLCYWSYTDRQGRGWLFSWVLPLLLVGLLWLMLV